MWTRFDNIFFFKNFLKYFIFSVWQYLPLAREKEVQFFFEKLIQKHNQNLLYNPYVSAFDFKKELRNEYYLGRNMYSRQHSKLILFHIK